MQTQISVFQFQAEKSVRVEVKNGEPLFCLTDVADILEISNANPLRFKLKESGIHKMYIRSDGQRREITFINEPNLYRVIFRSNKAEALKFQDWIFEEVLPTIRKTGGYTAPQAAPQPAAPEQLPDRADLVQLIIMYEARMAEVFGWKSPRQQADWYMQKFTKMPNQATYSELAYMINLMHGNTTNSHGAPIVQTIPLPRATEQLKMLVHQSLAAASLLKHTAAALLHLNQEKAVQMQAAANAFTASIGEVQREYHLDKSSNALYPLINWNNPPKQVNADLEKLRVH